MRRIIGVEVVVVVMVSIPLERETGGRPYTTIFGLSSLLIMVDEQPCQEMFSFRYCPSVDGSGTTVIIFCRLDANVNRPND